MIKIYVPMFLLCFFASAFAQTPVNKISGALETKMSNVSATDEILVWIYFADKGINTDYFLSNPLSVVSEKSIKRRAKVFTNSAPLTMRDLPVNSDYTLQVKLKGFKAKWPSRWLNAVSGTATKIQINQIATLPCVKKIDIVYRLRKGNQPEFDLSGTTQKNNEQQPEGVNVFDYGASFAQLQQINVPPAHDSGFTGQGITICVMDAGFNRLSHDAFLSMNIIAAWDFVNNDPNVGNEADMGEGSHGTMTLSTIGGYAPGHLIGPAFNSSYILAKTENTDSETPIEEDNWIAAMEWADSIGVDVTSTSLGYLTYDPPYTSYTWMDMDGNTTIITKAADYATHIGIVVVNSAGNEGYNASHNTLIAPADGDSVITAGAVDYSGNRSSFSSVGPTFDGRIKPDIMALGSGDVVASPYGDHLYTNASGTSFSCPLSAGVAALILCSNPNLTPMQVRDAMRNTASQNSNPDNLYGWGILNTLNAINYFLPPDTTFQLSVQIYTGWNLVSIPGNHPDGNTVDNWWPYRDSLTNVFRYHNGYQVVDTLIPAVGYWLKHLSTRLYNTGDEWPAGGIQIVPNVPIAGATGWNLIGGYELSVLTANITTTPGGLKTGQVFGYSGGYTPATNLVPGYGYWIKLTGSGSINIPTSLAKGLAKTTEVNTSDWGKIIITDNGGKSYTLYTVKGDSPNGAAGVNLNDYELPPSPPEGMFDVRYGSGRYAEDLSSGVQSIDMQGVEYPIKVKAENAVIRLQDASGNGLNERLKSGEEVVISNSSINKLMVSGEVIPDKYALEQNYPNPFNPSTKIEFSIPEDVNNVTLTIYNALGQRVAELVNSKLEAGKYSYVWNASDVATGLYIYELRTDKFVSVKKMLLLK